VSTERSYELITEIATFDRQEFLASLKTYVLSRIVSLILDPRCGEHRERLEDQLHTTLRVLARLQRRRFGTRP